MTGFCTVYVTTSNEAEAVAIAEALVGERLVACANVVPEIRSVYRWQGQIERDTEAALLCKTREELVARVAARVRELHSYDTPCVVVWPIVAGDAGYLAWLGEETKPAPD